MNALADRIERHNSTIKAISGTIASVGLDKAGRFGGFLVTPATWAIDYAVNDTRPGFLDISLYGIGLLNPFTAIAATATGTLKSIVDDQTADLLKQVRADEPFPYNSFIKSCSEYASSPAQINAMSIASRGGTAWQHSNGLWVFITDARGFMVHNYTPQNAKLIYQPISPLKKNSHGAVEWKSSRP